MNEIVRRTTTAENVATRPTPVNTTFVLPNDTSEHVVKVTMQSGGGGEPSPVNVPWSYNAAQ